MLGVDRAGFQQDHNHNSREYLLRLFSVKRIYPLLLLAGVAAARAQPSRAAAVEGHRAALQSRMESLRARIRDSLRVHAPDLLRRLDPAAPPVRQGYRLLPRVIADAPPSADTGAIVAVYSWPWTDSLIARGHRKADSVATLTRGLRERRTAERVVRDFNALTAHRRLIDSHVEHNRQWQRAAANDTARFAMATRAIDAVLAGTLKPTIAPPASPQVDITVDESAGDTTTLRVLLVTDITDTTFLEAFQRAVESQWRANDGPRAYRVALMLRRVSPAALYCREARPDCAPRAGATIDLTDHLSRFPPRLAVLTTGASQTQVVGGRAIVLGPRDIAPRTIAHEFGHLLGFDDVYLRGARDLGRDGLAIVELVPDRRDIMASPGFGSVAGRHLAQAAANVKADNAMRAGLAALYERRDARAAVLRFREALALRPDHYGGTFQLARALDAAGDSASATVVWRRMLDLATATNDASTLRTVRSRLGLP